MGIYRTNNVLEYAQVDGIVIDEKAADPSIKGVGTNKVLLLGQFQRGVEEIAAVTSTKQFYEEYGNDNSYLGNIALLNKRFGSLKLLRVVASDAVAALLVLEDGAAAAVATLTAKHKGAYGNSIKVVVEAGTTLKKITISDTNVKSTIQPEIYDEVNGANVAVKLAGSLLVDVSAIDDTKAFGDIALTALATGDDGTIADTDYEDALALSQEDLVANIVILDEYNATRNLYMKAHAAITQERMCIMGGAVSETVTSVEGAVALLRDTDGRLIYAYNWIETLVDGVKLFTSPASWIASIMSQTGPQVDPAYALNTKFLYGAISVKQKLGRGDYIRLMNAGVCSFENDADIGIKLKSGVVTQIANSSKLTILRRRMADWYTNSIGIFLKLYQNDINSEEKRTDVNAAIKGFDNTYSQGAQKILPSDSEVKTGKALLIDTETLNTDQSIGEGKFFIKIKRRIYSSMRFIVLIAEIGETVVVTEGEE